MDTKQFLQELIDIGSLKFGEFTLASGDKSDFYLDLRYLPAYPDIFINLIKQISTEIVTSLDYDLIIGIPTAGTPFATALAVENHKPQQLLRKQPKEHGLGKQIEGPDIENKKVLLVDDLISSGYSKNFAIEAIRSAGGIVNDVVVVVNRSEGKSENWSNQAEVTLHSLFKISKAQILKLK